MRWLAVVLGLLLAPAIARGQGVPIWQLPQARTPFNGTEAVPLSQTNNNLTSTYQTALSNITNNPAPPPGAKCDGVTNDTAAFQAALSVVGAAVWVPPATCVIGSLSPTTNTTLQGVGPASILKLGSNIGASVATGMIQLTSVSGVTIKNLSLDGNRSTFANTNNWSIYAPATGTGVSNITIDNIEVKSPGGAGIIFLGPSVTSRDSNISVSNSYIHDTGYHALITQGYVDHVRFSHNRVYYYGQLYTGDSVGITCGRYGVDCIVDGNEVAGDPNQAGASDHCISLDGGYQVIASNNIVSGCVGFGIEQGASSAATIVGNVITNTRRAGISPDGQGTPAIAVDGVTTSSSTTITSATANFYPGMVGRWIKVSGCQQDHGTMVTPVAAVTNYTTISVGTACSFSQTGVTITWPAVPANTTITGNTLINAGSGGASGIFSNINSPVLAYVTAADATCTSGSTTFGSPTVSFATWMIGWGASFAGCDVQTASSGTYSSGPGAVVLTGVSGIGVGNALTVSAAAGTGSFASINGAWTVFSQTATTTTFIVPAGLTMTITGATVTSALPTVIKSITDANHAVGTVAASATVGPTAMQVATPYGMDNGLNITGNFIKASGNAAILADYTARLLISSNTLADSGMAGVNVSTSNWVMFRANQVYGNNTSLTVGQAGLLAQMNSGIGSKLTAIDNDSYANGDGTGGAQDEVYTLDTVAVNFADWPLSTANALNPLHGGGALALGTTNSPWSMVQAATSASAASTTGIRRGSTIFTDSALAPLTLLTTTNTSLGAYGKLKPFGEFVVWTANGAFCKFFLEGNSNAVIKEYDAGTDGGCSTTKANAATTNVYYDGSGSGGAGYYIENQIATTRTYYVLSQGT